MAPDGGSVSGELVNGIVQIPTSGKGVQKWGTQAADCGAAMDLQLVWTAERCAAEANAV